MIIRECTAGDETAWRGLWQGFLEYYRVDLAPEITALTWVRLMDPTNPLKARLAVVDGVVCLLYTSRCV